MAITHFEFIGLIWDAIAITEVDGVAAVQGTDYPIAQENLVAFTVQPNYDGYILSLFFTWRVKDNVNNIVGPTTLGILQYEPRDFGTEVPTVADETLELLNDSQFVMIDEVGIGDNVEYIEIESIQGLNNWKFKGNFINPGDRLEPKDFGEVVFDVLSSGGGAPYSKLNFDAYNRNGTGVKTFAKTINVIALAEIQSISQTNENFDEDYGDPASTYNTIKETCIAEIHTAHINSDINVEIVINSPFLALNTYNQIRINYGLNEEIKTANETFNITVKTDRYGKADIELINTIVEDAAGTKTGAVTFNLVDVNGNAAYVALSNNSLTFNTSLGT